MFTIVTTAIKFAAGYVLADVAINSTKKMRADRRKKSCPVHGSRRLNYAPLFAG